MSEVVEEALLDPHDNPKQVEWDDETVCELEKLLTKNLHAHFNHAMKTIVGCGYKEPDAETIILRSRVVHGNGDIVSSILAAALASVNKREPPPSGYQSFENLESLVKFTLLEMVCALREVQPSLTVFEAMWLTFVWDFNLSKACKKEIGPHEATMGKKDAESTNAKSTPGNPGSNIYPMPKFALKRLATGGQSTGLTAEPAPQLSKSLHVTREKAWDLYQRSAGEENDGRGKILLSDIYKHEKLFQKELVLEKSFKGRISTGAFKGRFMPLKSSGSSGPIMKNSSSNIATSSGSVSEKADSNSLPPIAGTPKIVKDANFDAGIPYDTTLKKYIPQDEKDEAILELVPYLEKLQTMKQSWSDWANQKIQQVMTRIKNVKAEMKAVEKELGVAKKSQMNFQTNRHVEMEQAWVNTVALAESTDSIVRRLQTENSTLSLKLKSAESQVLESASNLEKALQQEQIVLKNSQSIDMEKRLLQQEFTSQKKSSDELVRQLEKANVCLKQFEDQWKQENKEKLKYLSEAETLRGRRKQLEEMAKAEEKAITERSKHQIQKVREKIKKLEAEISVLNVSRTLQTRTAMDFGSSSSMGSKNTDLYPGVHALSDVDQRFSEIDKKRERECVVCLAEERSVLFLPCAHQVVCTQCIIQYGKEMKECPSCRTPIQKQIHVRYHTSD